MRRANRFAPSYCEKMTDETKAAATGHQEQFLKVLSREDAMARFQGALAMKPLGVEQVSLAQSLGRVLAETLRAPIDVPPFDRSSVDGFAVRSSDVAGATEAKPIALSINGETIACGHQPALEVMAATSTPIATGGPIPRGADAIVMIEQTDPAGDKILIRRPVAPGQNIGFAGSDIARGETLLRHGQILGSREIGMLAACGVGSLPVFRKPRVAVLSTGDELVQPGAPLKPAAIYDSNGPIVAAAVTENGGEALFIGAIEDNAQALETALRQALVDADMVILSGGTSKSAGDLTYQIVGRLGQPGIIAHGVALKPGKPLCLAVADGKPVVILPGFPTSAMFTFHDFVVPVLRAMSGLPVRSEHVTQAKTTVRILSDLGRTEFVMVALAERDEGLIAFPLSKGSGSVSAFSQADGFLTVDALSEQLREGSLATVNLFEPNIRAPDLTIMGSHCVGLEIVLDRLADQGLRVRTVAIGSLGGLAAVKRGDCDIAPMHILDPKTGLYNEPFIGPELALVKGWQRMQGLVFRPGDPRFEGRSLDEAIATALSDPTCQMVNRNDGSGTRALVDGLLKGAKPSGYWIQPKSHNAVAAAVAQKRADWGVAIAPVAKDYGLGFIPMTSEHYDFAIPRSRLEKPAVKTFLKALHEDETAAKLLREFGFSTDAGSQAAAKNPL